MTVDSMTRFEVYETSHILNVHKRIDGGWFWDKYSASPYTGCQWGCEYCYCRDERFNPHKNREENLNHKESQDPFSQHIKIKRNAPQLLRKALKNKPVDIVTLSGYQLIDMEYRYMRGMLEVCLDLGFPVFLNEKSDFLLKDLDILKKLSLHTNLNVGWSIVFAEDDENRRAFEPKAPSIERRFKAMQELANNNIMTGTILMPILPFVTDSEDYIADLIRETKEHGGKYVLEGGLTLNGYTKIHFYDALRKYDRELISEYNHLFSDEKAMKQHLIGLHETIETHCSENDLLNYIPRPIAHYPQNLQLNKAIAGQLYVTSREAQLSAQPKYRVWAYRKAAWSIDELDVNIETIYEKEGTKGLTRIKNVGPKIGAAIEKELTK